MRISDWSSDVCSSDLPFLLIAASGIGYWPPALLTRPSMRPRSASTLLTACFTASSSRISKISDDTLPPSSRISAAVVSSFSALRPVMTTCAPRLASSCAVQRPMPEPPPVTMTVRSEEHTSELQSLMRISYAVFCLKQKKMEHDMTHTQDTHGI